MLTPRLHGFHNLMRHRIEEVLLVASPYDAFILEEDGPFSEQLFSESHERTPALLSVDTGERALAHLRAEHRDRLLVTTPSAADMSATELARRIKGAGLKVPVVLLAYDTNTLASLRARGELSLFDHVFVWRGDVRLLPAIVRSVEDQRNVEHDARTAGVQVVLLIEDSVRYYSAFLPVVYGELLTQSQRLLSEGMNLAHKLLRLRARPKILLCRSWEEAWVAFTAYEEEILGIVSDVEFPRDGKPLAEAGFAFARLVRERVPDVPVLLQSSRPENKSLAREAGASFLVKGSPLLLVELRRFMTEYFGFGDFVFRTSDGREVGRARDLRDLEEKLRTVPAASIAYHAERNHFSKWLKARTEFALAQKLRPGRVTDFATHEDLRKSLLTAVGFYRKEQNRTRVSDFDRQSFDGTGDFYRVGGGSLGGKARGLAFVRSLLLDPGLLEWFPGVSIAVPESLVLATDVFDRFLEENNLRDVAVATSDDEQVLARFLSAPFPEEIAEDLAAILARVHGPLAVRSSSILEDSKYQPFVGVYETVMLANGAPGIETRLADLLFAVKRVFASTFFRRAKSYLLATPFRVEEEKMAVILQRLVGSPHGSRFYPDVSGVARSHNFYPRPPQRASDGIAAVALGLGRTVVDGEACARFSPKHPRLAEPFGSAVERLDASQRAFWALDLAGRGEVRLDLDAAETDGTLLPVGSTFVRENDAIVSGLARAGVRLVTLDPLLQHGNFPLAEILDALLGITSRGMSAPVEIEFAVNLKRREFGFLQVRPLSLTKEPAEIAAVEAPKERLLAKSAHVMGNGRVDDLCDVVLVDPTRFERAKSRETAQEIARLNADLAARGVPYLLLGVGRWGSRDPWLGIPVTWDQISAARVIVESALPGLAVAPSQGSHFFQNLVTFNVGYFTVSDGEGFIDWDWLAGEPAVHEKDAVRHLRLERPVGVRMNGASGEGVILKPQ